MQQDEHEAVVATFIRSKGITRCPTACSLPTQGTVSAADRAALRDCAAARSQSRQQQIVARERCLWAFRSPAVLGE
jgi:hypothetical protein